MTKCLVCKETMPYSISDAMNGKLEVCEKCRKIREDNLKKKESSQK